MVYQEASRAVGFKVYSGYSVLSIFKTGKYLSSNGSLKWDTDCLKIIGRYHA